MTPELRNQIIAGLCRSLVVYIAARLSIGALDQGHLDQVVAALTVVAFAGLSALSKWRAAKKAAVKIEQLKTVVADSHAETGVLIDSLIQAKVPIPELPPTAKSASIEELAAALQNPIQNP